MDSKIYVLGGESNATEVYDPLTDTCTTAAQMPVTPHFYSGWNCASVVVDCKIHVMGFDYRSRVAVAFHEIYDLETDKWSSGSEWSSGGFYSSAGATTGVNVTKRVYIFGLEAPA